MGTINVNVTSPNLIKETYREYKSQQCNTIIIDFGLNYNNYN